MTDYAKMRLNMVDGQLRPNGITAPEIIQTFLSVPRERFLTGGLQASAYVDDTLPVSGRDFLMEPLVFARMLQSAALQPEHTVLNIGDATGYSSAVLSRLTTRVIVREEKPGQLTGAQAVWSALGYSNIALAGDADSQAFNIILLNGAVAAVPEDLLAQLIPGGRLIAVVRKDQRKTGELTVIEKDGDGVYSRRKLFDTAVPYLPGFEPAVAFQF